jgi:hypothetical protein
MDWERGRGEGAKMDRGNEAIDGSPEKIVRAYRDMTRMMADEGSSLEDLQGAVEYLLDALKDAQQSVFSRR